MKSFFKKLLSKKAKEVSAMYDFRTLSMEEVDNYPDGLKDLKTRKIDGFIVKGALSPDEVKAIDNYTRKMQKNTEDVLHTPKGYVYPMPFSAPGVERPDSEQYFIDMKTLRKEFAQNCGVDIENKLFTILGKMAGGRKVSTPDYKKDVGSAVPFTLRFLKEKTGVVEVHCGNLFHGNHSVFYDNVNPIVETYDQLSYFYVIQPSESSDLILLDSIWEAGQSKVNFEQVYTFNDQNGKEVDCTEYGIDRKTIKLEPGDFLTFAGGPIWHLVEEVKGKKGRITVGGFMGFSHDDKTLYAWS
jgi:hypothetical protein